MACGRGLWAWSDFPSLSLADHKPDKISQFLANRKEDLESCVAAERASLTGVTAV